MTLLPRLNYADLISENYVKLTIQIPSLPNKRKLRQTKNRSENILSAPYFPPSNRWNHRGRLETGGKMKKGPNYRQKHIFHGICVKSTTKEIFILVSMYHWLNTII